MKKVLIMAPRFYRYNFSIANAFNNLGYTSSVIEYLPGEVSSKYGVNQRFFEITGSKNFQLVDNNPYIPDYFSPEEIMTYDSLDDLLHKIENVLDGKTAVDKITQNGYQKIIANNTFTHRIQ